MSKQTSRPSFHLDQGNDTPLYLQLAEALRKAIRDETFSPGDRLPSIRALADAAAVNPATAVAAYRILEKEGTVLAKAGSGVYVTDLSKNDALAELALGRVVVPPGAIDMAAGSPSPDLFPALDFKELAAEVLERDGGRAFGYTESSGYPPFREAAARFLSDFQGFTPAIEDLLVVSGAQQGIDLAAKTLVGSRDTVAVESPTYRGAASVFWSRGASTVGIPLEGDGMDLSALEEVAQKGHLRLVYVIPRYQNPTTICWSREKMLGLLALAERYDFFVLEDDFVSDLWYDQAPEPASLKALDNHDRVIYVRSFSKVLLPGLRLGFVVSPACFRGALDAAKRVTDIATDGLAQRIVDLYLRRGLHLDQRQRLRAHFHALYQATVAGLRNLAPQGISFCPPGGGLHLWVRLPLGMTGTQLYRDALARGCVVVPEGVYSANEGDRESRDEHLRLSFASLGIDEAKRGIRILEGLIARPSGPRSVLPLL